MAHGFEIGLTPVVLGAIGYLIDRAAGTTPVFIIVFVVLGVIGLGLRYYYTFRYLMAEQDAQGPVRAQVRRRSRVGQR
jgi:F0F1-type ATP synthase assembly protein I